MKSEELNHSQQFQQCSKEEFRNEENNSFDGNNENFNNNYASLVIRNNQQIEMEEENTQVSKQSPNQYNDQHFEYSDGNQPSEFAIKCQYEDQNGGDIQEVQQQPMPDSYYPEDDLKEEFFQKSKEDLLEIIEIQGEKLQQQNENIQNKERLLTQMREFHQDLCQTLEETQDEIVSLQTEKEELEKILQQRNEELEELKNIQNMKEILIEELKQQNEQISQEHGQFLENYAKSIQQLEYTLNDLQVENNQLMENQEKLTLEKLQQQDEIQALNEKITSIENQFIFLQQKNQELQKTNQIIIKEQRTIFSNDKENQQRKSFLQKESANFERIKKNPYENSNELQGRFQLLDEKNKQEQQYLQLVLRDVQNMLGCDNFEQLGPSISQLKKSIQKSNKFIKSIQEMIFKLVPQNYFGQTQPSLKEIWRILKQCMEEYMIMLKNTDQIICENEIMIRVIEKAKMALGIQHDCELQELENIIDLFCQQNYK